MYLGGDVDRREPGHLCDRSRFLPFEVKHDNLTVHGLEPANKIEYSRGLKLAIDLGLVNPGHFGFQIFQVG